MTEEQPHDDAEAGEVRTRRRRRRARASDGAEGRERTSPLSTIGRLLRETAVDSSRDAPVREADEELRQTMSPAFEKLLEAVPGASSPDEAAEALAAGRGGDDPEDGDSPNRRAFVPEDTVETLVQYRVREHFVRRPAVGHHERGLTDGVLVGGTSAAANGDGAADPTGYLSGFAERMRQRSEQDPS